MERFTSPSMEVVANTFTSIYLFPANLTWVVIKQDDEHAVPHVYAFIAKDVNVNIDIAKKSNNL